MFRILTLMIFILLTGFYFMNSGLIGKPAVNEKGCVNLAGTLGYEHGCITTEEREKYCAANNCGAMHKYENEEGQSISQCYKLHGACEKTESGCGWKKDAELENCVSMLTTANTIKTMHNTDPMKQWNEQ